MLTFLILFVSLFSFGHLADHDTFKDCSRVDFCNTLRNKEPLEYYVPSDSFLYTFDGTASFAIISNDNTSTLTVNVTKLLHRSVRIQITEADSNRYQLQDVLDGQPETATLQHISISNNKQIIIGDEYNITINYSPFSIQVSIDEDLLVTFNGSRLLFDNSLDQAFTFGVTFPKAQQLYGIHEHADSLALRTTQGTGSDPYRLKNLDAAGYDASSPMALYGAVPVLYGHGVDATSGIFLHNAAEQWIEVNNQDGAEAYFMVESGSLDLFVLLGTTPTEVVRQYVTLTGTAHLPQLWALGYHQSRWNYVSQEDVKDVVANFTTYNFPLDVIWLDIEYTDGKKYFTWDSSVFSDPVEMQQNISAAHKRLVTIIDPHIKVETGYNVYDGALEQDLFVKNANGSVFQGDCWPGLSSYMDFLNPAARDYYASFYSYENFPSTTPVLAGIWNDMNEPSVFDNSIEKTLPEDALHYGGVAHKDIHNIYGFLHTMSTHQGLMNRDNSTRRPFVLTRSHFAGTQRYSAIWTGDNQAGWDYLSVSYSECLNANILGIVFCGADIGGFSNEPSIELLERWYQAGVWLPFYRAHSDNNSKRREPYLFDEDVQEVIRNALLLRYKHLPVWYTLFYEHTRNKDPVIRPLFYQYPSDPNIFNISDHLLLGTDILVRAISEPEVTTVPVYFPGGDNEVWVSIDGKAAYRGSGMTVIPVDIENIPVFYRRGSIIVRKDTERLSSDEMLNDNYTLYAIWDSDLKATGTVYIDDYTSFNYVNNKEYNYLRIDIESDNISLTAIDEDANSADFPFQINNVVVYNVTDTLSRSDKLEVETIHYKIDFAGYVAQNKRIKAVRV